MSGANKVTRRAASGKLVYAFPPEVVAENYMMLTVIEKSRPDKNGAVTTTKGRYFILPIPGNLQVQSKMDYEQKSLGVFGALSAGMIEDGSFGSAAKDLTGMFRNKMDAARNIFKDESDMSDEEIKAAGRAKDQLLASAAAGGLTLFANKIGGPIAGLLGAATVGADVVSGIGLAERIAINPHLAVLFKNVGLRSFQFQYKFVARSQEESIQIRNMIRALQYHMHPEMDIGSFAFRYPDEFEIIFSENRREWLFDIKQCVLTDLSVNYNGENLPIFFNDNGGPVSVDITMSFQETKIFTKTDYADEEDLEPKPQQAKTLQQLEQEKAQRQKTTTP